MKTKFILLIALFAPRLLAAPDSGVLEMTVGVSPFLPAEQKRAVASALTVYLLKTAPMGTHVQLCDAWNLTSIATVDVPVLKLADAPQARAQQPGFAAALGKLKRWFDSGTSEETNPELKGSAALKTPEWLELISRQPVTGRRTILLVGSPIYMNLSEPSFSMNEARYPSDGHLACKLTESVFGLAEKKNRLIGNSVHWSYLGEQAWENELHRTAVTRFWGLFVGGQAGTLATFQADLETALVNGVKPNLGPCAPFQIDPADTKPVMRTARPRQVPDWIQQVRPETPSNPKPVAPKQVDTLSRSLTNSVPTTPPAPVASKQETGSRAAPIVNPPAEVKHVAAVPTPNPLPMQPATGKTGVGIIWDADVDLDLYVKAHKSAPELFFKRTTSREGHYFFDYRNRNSHLDYEYVELRNPVDLGQLEVWVNYYAGKVPAPGGKVCLHYGGKTYVGSFALPASRGNQSVDAHRRGGSPYWTELKLQEIISTQSQP